MSRTPALVCLSEAKAVCVPGLTVGEADGFSPPGPAAAAESAGSTAAAAPAAKILENVRLSIVLTFP
jgi:hypothetical protein